MTEWCAAQGRLEDNHVTIHTDADCCALSYATTIVSVERADYSADEVCVACKRRQQGKPQCAGPHETLEAMDASEVFADD